LLEILGGQRNIHQMENVVCYVLIQNMW